MSDGGFDYSWVLYVCIALFLIRFLIASERKKREILKYLLEVGLFAFSVWIAHNLCEFIKEKDCEFSLVDLFLGLLIWTGIMKVLAWCFPEVKDWDE